MTAGCTAAPRRAPPAAASLLAAAAALAVSPAAAASQLGGPCAFAGIDPSPLHLDRLRIAQLRGERPATPLSVTRSGHRRLVCQEGDRPLLALAPLAVTAESNSDWARDLEDGLRWAGRGASIDFQVGALAGWGPFSAAFVPRFAWAANEDFPILEITPPDLSPFTYPLRILDLPQRFGDRGFWWSHPGESYVRVDAYGVALGWSTERMRWGPGRVYPILHSATGPGYPHVFLGTSGPADIRIGTLEVEAIWGHLHESDFFDGDPANDRRLMAGLVLALQPRGLEGLAIGFARAYVQTLPPDGIPLLDYLRLPYTDILTNRITDDVFASENELFSLFGRWALPGSRAEVYGELARDDHWEDTRDIFLQPDHSLGFLVGFQKLVGPDDRPVRVAGELMSLNFSETVRGNRTETIFYTHSAARQGYTHRGQILGAPPGPSSDAQMLEVDLLRPHWQAGAFLERRRYANDLYYDVFANRYSNYGHDVEVTGGLRGAYEWTARGVELFGAVRWSGRYNRSFVGLQGPYNTTWGRNLSLQIGASWSPASGRSAPGRGPGSPSTRP